MRLASIFSSYLAGIWIKHQTSLVCNPATHTHPLESKFFCYTISTVCNTKKRNNFSFIPFQCEPRINELHIWLLYLPIISMLFEFAYQSMKEGKLKGWRKNTVWANAYANQLSTLAIIQVRYLNYWTVKLLWWILIVKNIERQRDLETAQKMLRGKSSGVMKVENGQNEIFP